MDKPDQNGLNSAEAFRDILLSAVTSGPAMIAITDTAGRFVFVNRRYEKLTNYTPEELIGKPSSILKSGLLPDDLYRDLWKTLKDGREWRGEFHNKRKDGSEFWESALIAPIRNAAGEITHYLKVAEDITLRKKAEMELQASNEVLKEQSSMLRTSYARLEEVTKALEESERRLRHLSHVDSLTGLLNRRGFDEEFHRMLALAERHGRGVGLLVIDIDHFKQINDTRGHASGDTVLRECAMRLKSGLRATDVLCRHGGDEMIAALPLVTSDETMAAAQRLRMLISGAPFDFGEPSAPVTVSIGAVWTPRTARGTDRRLIDAADRALYEAKESGRDRVCFQTLEPADGPDTAPAAQGGSSGTPALRNVLVVDGDPAVLGLMREAIENTGCAVRTCATGADARQIANRLGGSLDVVFVELHLPDENGLQVLQDLHRADRTLVGIMMTDRATVGTVVAAMHGGAFDFVAKPFAVDTLRDVLRRALDFRATMANRDAVASRGAATETSRLSGGKRSRRARHLTMEALAAMLDAREHSTGEHSIRVAQIAEALARALRLPQSQINIIRQSALLHDIGKISIPDAVLFKEGPLNDDDWAIIRRHPEAGHAILKADPGLNAVAEIVLSHHERFDGTGYPRGLAGENICFGARIFTVADAYDVMRTRRVYSSSMTPREALEELRRNSGTQFDPTVIDAMTQCQAKIEALCLWPAPDHSPQDRPPPSSTSTDWPTIAPADTSDPDA